MNTQILTHCHAALANSPSFFWALFLGGLVGSATHCAGMCGPFVLSQVTTRLDALSLGQLSEWKRLQGAALLPYHAGRMTTYVAMGIMASLLTASFKASPWFHAVSAVLLCAAGLVFLVSSFRFLPVRIPSFKVAFPEVVLRRMQALFAQPKGWRGYALGLILGLLPCGLVYAALMAVAARGETVMAALGMILFTLGTVPALVAVGLGGRFILGRFQPAMRAVFPLLMVFSSFTLFSMAGDLIK